MYEDWGKKNQKTSNKFNQEKIFLKVISNRNVRYKPQFPTFYLYLRNFSMYKNVVVIVSYTMTCGFVLACESILCQNLNV